MQETFLFRGPHSSDESQCSNAGLIDGRPCGILLATIAPLLESPCAAMPVWNAHETDEA